MVVAPSSGLGRAVRFVTGSRLFQEGGQRLIKVPIHKSSEGTAAHQVERVLVDDGAILAWSCVLLHRDVMSKTAEFFGSQPPSSDQYWSGGNLLHIHAPTGSVQDDTNPKSNVGVKDDGTVCMQSDDKV